MAAPRNDRAPLSAFPPSRKRRATTSNKASAVPAGVKGRNAWPSHRPGANGQPIAAEAFLRALADHGVDYFFCNPGTDFPPIVEAFSRAKKTNAKVPKPILVPHENLAVAMAHGAYLMNGRPQAVMVHVNVGTGNTINNLTNLSRDRVPLILAAGRTPITEKGAFGSRSRPIHWAQEMFDQAGMVRELVKWDYELRVPGQVGDVVARAVEVAMAHPRGPVYLVLPREPLSAPLPEPIAPIKPRPQAAADASRSERDRDAGRMDRGGRAAADHRRHPAAAAVPALAHLAERCAIPVVTNNPRNVCLPSSHADAFRFRAGRVARRRRSGDRARIRRAVDSEPAASAGRLPRRACRRGSVLRALSDALLPQRSRRAGRRRSTRWKR